jgi:hypothetical protein
MMQSSQKNPWPTQAVMEQIYSKHLWGGESKDFYSGEGSHLANIIRPYIEAVTKFLKTHNGTLSICDLGCGDFNVGKELVPFSSNYHGIDIVSELILRNKDLFKSNHFEFHCLDISKDDLPAADCAILRQVLQHLSNEEIMLILKKLRSYRHIILTEHLPTGNFVPNKNQIANLGNRLIQQSGVNVEVEPFNFQFLKKEVLCDIPVVNRRITTFLYQIF